MPVFLVVPGEVPPVTSLASEPAGPPGRVRARMRVKNHTPEETKKYPQSNVTNMQWCSGGGGPSDTFRGRAKFLLATFPIGIIYLQQ